MLEYMIISGVIGLLVGGSVASVVTASMARNKNKQRRVDLEKALNEIQGKTEKLTLLTGNMAQKDQDLLIAQKKVKEQDTLLGKKDKEVSELQNQVKRQQVLLQEANENVHAKGQSLEELQENLNEQTVTLQHKEQEIGKLNGKIADAEQSLVARDKELVGLREEMQQKLEQAQRAQEDMRGELENAIHQQEEKLNRQSAEATQLAGEVAKWRGEQASAQKTAEEYHARIGRLESEQQEINRLRAQAVHDLRRTLAMLESVAIPDDLKIEGEVSFSIEEPTGTEELTIQLAEQEKQLREKDELLQQKDGHMLAYEQQVVELQSKVKELSETIKLTGQQDNIIQEQARTLQKYEDQLVEFGQMRADLIEREEKISEYRQAVEALQKKLQESQTPQPSPQAKDVDAKDAILQDPNLTMAHKKTMVMLYSQYTSPRKALKKQMEEGEKAEPKTDQPAAIPPVTDKSSETGEQQG
jgi:chromosome segregation ATPase